MKAHARIGPNAVTQLIAAFEAQAPALMRTVFDHARVSNWIATPPHDMVDEMQVARLHQRVRAELGVHDARVILHDAGLRTADYILAHRIPRLFRLILPRLPSALAARLLTRAIARHAWTFAGTGRFRIIATDPLTLEIADNPLCRNENSPDHACAWHAGVFTRLFAGLVHPQAQAEEIACCTAGDAACRFIILWPAPKTWIQIKARLAPALSLCAHDAMSKPRSKDQSLAP